MRNPPRLTVALACCLGLALTGCGSDKKTAAQATPEPTVSAAPTGDASAQPTDTALPEVSADPTLAAAVPSALASAGTLTIGTDSTYAPNEFLAEDGHTIEGFDVDLFDAVAAKLGLETKYVTAPFTSIIPGIQSGKYDLGVSSFSINADRLKVATMVSYYSAGTQWAVQAVNPALASLDDACGKHIAVQTGTVEVDDLKERSTKCTDAGKKAITLDQYQGQDQATAAVVSGKDDAMSADSPVTEYAVSQTKGKLAVLGDVYGAAPYGYVLKKGETDFAKAIAAAVNALIADGTYEQILKHWGVETGAIDTSQVDPTP